MEAERGLGHEDSDPEDRTHNNSDSFPVNFKEYMVTELKYTRIEISDIPPGYENDWPKENWVGIRWVFWNRKDDELSLSHDQYVDSIPDVCASSKFRRDIRLVLHKLMLHPELEVCLAQFWEPTKTPEGRTSLTTQYQPFALGNTKESERQHLCKYRMGMYKDYTFYGDTESGNEQVGLPGRVFLNQDLESAEDVEFYSLKEYPQRKLALNCKICASLALPVFEYSSHACVGVLEIVSLQSATEFWHDEVFRGRMNEIFQEFGLQCFDGYKQCEIQYGDEYTALTAAFHEVKMVCDMVHRIHKLPLALTWVSCPSCKDLLHSQFQFQVQNNYENATVYIEVTKACHLRKGHFTGTMLPFPNSLYCSDVKQLSITEYPLVPNARFSKFGGRFTTCLHSSYTGNEVYVLEFFLPASNNNEENILKRLRLIVDTMKGYSKTFKLASGQEWGEELSIEVIDFQNDQKYPSIQVIPATRIIRSIEPLRDESMFHRGQLPLDPSNKGKNVVTAEPIIPLERKRKRQARELKRTGVKTDVSLEDILWCSELKVTDAARQLKVSIPTLRRICKENGIDRWPPRNIGNFQPLPFENQGQLPQQNFDLNPNEDSCSVAKINPGLQDADEEVHPLPSPVQNQGQSPPGNLDLHGNEDLWSVANFNQGSQYEEKVTIMAKFETYTLKFQLSLTSGLVELHEEVAKRRDLEAGTYYVRYEDEDDEGLILVTCDEDLQDYMKACKSQGKTAIPVQLDRK